MAKAQFININEKLWLSQRNKWVILTGMGNFSDELMTLLELNY